MGIGRRWRIRCSSDQRGFSPVEILLAATVFGFLVTGLVGAIVYGRASTASAGERARASMIAEEGVEAVRNIKDAAYSNLADGTYGLAQGGGQWVLLGSSDVTGIFTRQLVITTVDTVRKTITANVSWPDGSFTDQVSVVSRMTNWGAAIAAVTSWLNAVVGGGLDIASTNDALKVATAGNYAYVVRNGGTPNFAIVNVSNPATPTLTGSLALAGAPVNIAVSGNYAYVTTNSSSAEMYIVNIANPAAPSLAGTFNAAGTASGLGVFVSGTTAYLTRLSSATAGTSEFLIVNVATPATPTLIGSHNNDITIREVYVSGNYAYLATESDTLELLVVNIATPATPTLAASLNLAGSSNAMAVAGYPDRLLIAQGTTLRTINITTPTAPVQLGTVTPTGSGAVNDVTVEGTNTYAFIGTAGTTAEFQVVNITNPATPTIARVVDVTGTTSGLNGVAFNASLDIVAGASASDTQEALTFRKN